jgi:predicted nucleic acid-binding protein
VKVFFDSNVHISATVYGGAAYKAVKATEAAGWRMLTNRWVLEEFERIVGTGLGRGRGYAAAARENLADRCREIVTPIYGPHVAGDPNDTPVLRGALAGGADYLVTRDKHLLSLGRVESLRVITLAEYLDVLRSHGVAVE